MGRPIVLANGRLMVGLDERGFVHDFYYPFAGLENMTSSRQMHHRIGVWVDGVFSWLDDGTWFIELAYQKDTLVSTAIYRSTTFSIEIETSDFVDSANDIFGRRFYIKNFGTKKKDIRLFLHQVFMISRSGRSDTAIYVPSKHPYILTARGNITFLAGLRDQEGKSFDQYAVGNYRIEGKEGTYVDAEDGQLSGNNVEHGGVDSVMRTSFSLDPAAGWSVDYWICASSNNYHYASGLHRALAAEGLEEKEKQTLDFWQEWIGRSNEKLAHLNDVYRDAVKRALLVVKAHADEGGALIASGDSSIYNYWRDYYNYVWPRDAGLSLMPLVKLGYTEEAVKFLEFCITVANPKGYLHHKYQPDGAIGSTWHPLIQDGKRELNIQEDETATVVLLFCELEKAGTDKKILDDFYDRLIRPACHFLAGFIDISTGLPHGSYDLWEQIFQTSTYTACIVHRALCCAADSAKSRGDKVNETHWRSSATRIEAALPKLFVSEKQYYAKGLRFSGGEEKIDDTLDASTLAGLYFYGPLPIDNAGVHGTLLAAEKDLKNTSPVGGIIRYPGDAYMLSSKKYPGNPWYVCTLWLSRIYSALGRSEEAKAQVDWALSHQFPSGVLSEQLDAESGLAAGVAPLVWSHAELINSIMELK